MRTFRTMTPTLICKPGKPAIKARVAALLMVSCFTGFAQGPLTMDEAVRVALQNNPGVKSEEYNARAQQSLRKTSFDWGKTSVMLMTGQYNSLNQDQNLTISQTLPFPTVSLAESQYNKASAEAAQQSLSLTRLQLISQVRSIYTRLQFLFARERLLQSQDTLYGNFNRAANVRYTTGETNLLEKASAETQWMEIRNQLQMAARDIQMEQVRLQTLLHSDQVARPADALRLMTPSYSPDASVLAQHPALSYWKFQQQASAAASKMERNRFLPDITVGYFNQSLIGFQRSGTTETFYDKSKRFTGFMLGVSMPLWFVPQAGRAQAAQYRHSSAVQQAAQQERLLSSDLDQATREWEKYLANVRYYEKDALTNATLILRQAELAYKNGEIGYVEYLQSLRNAYSLQANYLEAIYLNNLSVIRLEYLKGQI